MGKIAIPARRTLLRILAFALCALPTYAQTADTGAIAGSVSDPSGEPVARAAVVLESEATREERNLTTDAEGNSSVPFLTPGNYDITESLLAIGFQLELSHDDYVPTTCAILRGGNKWADPKEKRHGDHSIRPPISCHRR
jgi:Carboxypeptidase regulatory-like domain